jgi:hypothetical protein
MMLPFATGLRPFLPSRPVPGHYFFISALDLRMSNADSHFRLPRNHPEVVSNLGDLAKCISVMPTSGSHFTAQAPLLPVFFLGLLATEPAHKSVSRTWFEQVVRTPVRSVSHNYP